MKGKTRIPLYPFLFAVYPVTHIYAANASTTELGDITRPLAAFLVFTALVMLIARLLTRRWVTAGLIASVVTMLVSGYAVGLQAFAKLARFFTDLEMSPTYRIVWMVVFACCMILLALIRSRETKLSRFLAVLGVMLVLQTLIQLGFSWSSAGSTSYGSESWQTEIDKARREAGSLSYVRGKQPPDIYYIILDQYARHDVLQRLFHCDDTDFLAHLKRKGFYVADKSVSNYPWTIRSLSSSLNMDYLDVLYAESGVDPNRRHTQLVWNNKVCRILSDKGYKFLMLNSGWMFTSGSPYSASNLLPSRRHLSELERVLMRSTALAMWWPQVRQGFTRGYVLGMFQDLEYIPRIKAPTFTIAHVGCPHDPYVFDPDGNVPVLPKSEKELYADQVRYLGKRIPQIVDTLIAESDVPPVIIIQADHGAMEPALWGIRMSAERLKVPAPVIKSSFRDRVCILNAYYFPGIKNKPFYSTITPVNTFRVMFNEYFGGHYPLLKDAFHIPETAELAQDNYVLRFTRHEVKTSASDNDRRVQPTSD